MTCLAGYFKFHYLISTIIYKLEKIKHKINHDFLSLCFTAYSLIFNYNYYYVKNNLKDIRQRIIKKLNS